MAMKSPPSALTTSPSGRERYFVDTGGSDLARRRINNGTLKYSPCDNLTARPEANLDRREPAKQIIADRHAVLRHMTAKMPNINMPAPLPMLLMRRQAARDVFIILIDDIIINRMRSCRNANE